MGGRTCLSAEPLCLALSYCVTCDGDEKDEEGDADDDSDAFASGEARAGVVNRHRALAVFELDLRWRREWGIVGRRGGPLRREGEEKGGT